MKQGFTLVELIMVITLLGIIALITVPTINTMITTSKEKAYDEQISRIENVAKTYMADNSIYYPSQVEGQYYCVSVETLKKAGLLSNDDIANPLYKAGSSNEEEANEYFDGAVKVTFTSNKYTYEYTSSSTC